MIASPRSWYSVFGPRSVKALDTGILTGQAQSSALTLLWRWVKEWGEELLTGHHALVVQVVHCTNLGDALAVCSRPGVMAVSSLLISYFSCLLFLSGNTHNSLVGVAHTYPVSDTLLPFQISGCSQLPDCSRHKWPHIFRSFSHREVEAISPYPWSWAGSCDLLWPLEYGKNGSRRVLTLGLKGFVASALAFLQLFCHHVNKLRLVHWRMCYHRGWRWALLANNPQTTQPASRYEWGHANHLDPATTPEDCRDQLTWPKSDEPLN